MTGRLPVLVCAAFASASTALVLVTMTSASAQTTGQRRSVPARTPLSAAYRLPWLTTLPTAVQNAVLWSADHEEGSFHDWEFPNPNFAGGGIFNTGGQEVSADIQFRRVHSGRFAAETTITNAYRAQNGNRAVRLMRWTDRPWNQGGTYFPDDAYYSTWVYFPETYNPNKYAPWDPGDGGWWNIFQFKCNDATGVSQPMFSVNVDHDDAAGTMSLYVYSGVNAPHSFAQAGTPRALPARTWVHLEARYVASTGSTGRLTLWQDGHEILDITGVQTVLPGDAEKPVFGVGNYTDHIAGGPIEGEATVFFDDCAVSQTPLHAWVP